MKQIIKKVFTLFIAVVMVFTSLPITALADGVQQIAEEVSESVNDPGYIAIDNGYLTIQVSTANGGFYVGTVEGDKLNKSDNNKNLLYPDEDFDTSFTSFRVTRDGKTRDYVFGRDYSYLGLVCEAVKVYQSADNAITAEWKVDGLRFTQIISLMGTDTFQHGMAYIAYSVQNESGSAVEKVDARVMMDTALGYQDYAIYMAGHADGSYTTIDREKTLAGSDYYNYFFAYDSKTAPTVTAYTLNASVGGETIVPEKVTFAHWNNLASTTFDYTPDTANPFDFTDQYNLDFMTADSAVALYYNMGGVEIAGQGKGIGLYYGVYSNYNAGNAEVTMNLTSSNTMFLNEDATAYKDLNGNLAGNYSSTIKVQNVGDETIASLAIAVYPGEKITPYNGNSLVTNADLYTPYYKILTDLRPGEARDVRFDFHIDPTYVSDYRKLKLVAYNISGMPTEQITLNDDNTVLTRETYVLCPATDGAEIGFTGMTPSTIFQAGRRFVYVTGSNFGLLRDKSQYRLVLRPMDGGDDVVLDQDMVVINPDKNTATLVLNQELRKGTWQLIVDWNDAATEDLVSDALRLIVSDVPQPGDPGFVSSATYGIVAIERRGNGRSVPYHYELVTYDSEEALKKSSTPAGEIMLTFRGDFNVMSSEERGTFQAEALTLMDGEIISISDTLDVKNGRVTITVNFDNNGKQTDITVDIDGKVYTTAANTKVWDGVCALTSLKEGKLYTLPVYSKQGKLGYASGEELGDVITLLWPSAAGVAQTLVGLMLDFRYGEFALMEQNGSYERVIAFGAKLSPSFLVPQGLIGNAVQDSKLEKAHRTMANTNYTASDLRATETQYEKDQRQWRKDQLGTLNLYMDDILFGKGGFIGFNTTIEVGIPSYANGLPSIEGSLNLKIIYDYWEVAVSGSADLMVVEMEATLALKSYNGVPILDTLYFFIGGVKPGIPVDPMGVFWIRGAGAGIDHMYESFFVASTIPPITLLLSGEFAIFNVLEARADLALSMRGIAVELSKIGIGGIKIIDSLSGSVYWYPSFSLSFGIRIDIFDAIIGQGSIVVQKQGSDGNFYFRASANALLKIPDNIWLIGGTKLASVGIGIDTKKVWGKAKIIGIGVGLVYYWGGDFDVLVGKKANKLDNIHAAVPVYVDPETGDTLYMAVTNNLRLLNDTDGTGGTVVNLSSDLLTQSFTLTDTGEDALIAFSYQAENLQAAQDYKNQIHVTVGGQEYPLAWYDNDYTADSEANMDTNAMLSYDAASATATVSISFTDESCFDVPIEIITPVALTKAPDLYASERMVDFKDVTFDEAAMTATLTGTELNRLNSLSVWAIDENSAAYPLADMDQVALTAALANAPAENTLLIEGISYPSNLPTGSYTLRVSGTVLDENGVETENPIKELPFSYVNVNQPTPVSSAAATLGGNYTVQVSMNAQDTDYDGYLVNIHEVNENGEIVETVQSDLVMELTEEEKAAAPENRSILVGGRYSHTDPETGETTYTGLEAGKSYVIAVQTYKTMEDGSRLLSTATVTEAITMVEPTVITPVLSVEGSASLQVGTTAVFVDTVNTSTVTIRVDGVEGTLRSGSYTLGTGEAVAWDGGNILLENLEDGMYTVTVNGVSETGDSFGTLYQFSVDTDGPGVLISSPQGGGFFDSNTVEVTGITEAGAKVVVGVKGGTSVTVYADEAGAFSATLTLDQTVAYQEIVGSAFDAIGNESMPFGCTLTNGRLGDPNLKAVILLNGTETDTLVSGKTAQQLSLAFKSDGTTITLNPGSAAAARVQWRTSVIEKTATVTESGVLTGDDGAVGIVVATLDNFTAMATMTTVDLSEIDMTLALPEGGYVYDGTAKTPAVTLPEGVALTKDTDYTVTYVNNVTPGTATAIVTATEDSKCTGIRMLDFSIAAASLDGGVLTIADDGSVNPAVTVTLGEKTLVKDTDYTVSYTLNNEMTAVIIAVTGIGGYQNVLSAIRAIKPAEQTEDAKMTFINPGAERPGVTVTMGGVTLTEGTDYLVTYTYNETKTAVLVSITGIGDYEGRLTLSRSIEIGENVVAEDPEDPPQQNEEKPFDHLIWIIPTATVAVLGIAALALFFIKRARIRKRGSGSDPDNDPTGGDAPEEPSDEAPTDGEDQ